MERRVTVTAEATSEATLEMGRGVRDGVVDGATERGFERGVTVVDEAAEEAGKGVQDGVVEGIECVEREVGRCEWRDVEDPGVAGRPWLWWCEVGELAVGGGEWWERREVEDWGEKWERPSGKGSRTVVCE
jgi:hypothetical protein